MNKLLLALVLMIGASICLIGCNKGGNPEQAKADSKKEKDANESDPPKKPNENQGGIAQAQTPKEEPSKKEKGANESESPKKSDDNKGNIANTQTPREEPGKKESKDEPLYKGKPASFWINQLKDRDASFRLDAVKALREIGTEGDGVVLALVKTLGDKEKSVQDAAREAIGSLPLEGRIPALIQILRGKEKSVRPAAIELLGDIGSKGKDAIPDLTKALMDEDPDIRSRGANALGKIGVSDKSALTALVKLLDDKDNSVRLASTQALAEIGKDTEVALPSLIARLSPKKEEYPSIRLETIKTLWIIGKQNGKALSAILVACGDADQNVSKQARKSIADVEVKQRISILAHSLKTDDNKTRLIALQFLREIGADAKEALPSLLERLSPKKKEDASIRLEAVKTLWTIGKQNDKVLSAILVACSDPDEGVSKEARQTISDVDVKQRVVILVQSLKNDDNKTRLIALQFLVEIGADAKEAVPAVVEMLNSEDDILRIHAAKMLAKLGKDAGPATSPLIGLLADKAAQVRMEAVKTLKTIPIGSKLPALIVALKDKNAEIRAYAVGELEEAGPDAKAAVPAVLEMLTNEDETRRIQAARMLGKFGKEAGPASPELISLLVDKSAQVRLESANTLKKIPIGSKLSALVAALKDKNAEIRAYAVGELKEVGPDAKGAVPALIPLLQEQAIRVSVAKALGKIGPDAKDAVPNLARLLFVDDKALRKVAMSSLAEIAEAKEAVPALVEVLKSDDEDLRIQAANMLGKVGKDAGPATPVLINLLVDKSVQVRLEAANALKKIPIVGKLPALVEALKDKNAEIRSYAVGELEMAGPDAKEAVPAVVEMLKSGDEDLRIQAAKTLGKVGKYAGPATPSLISLLEDKSAQVRMEAANALKRISIGGKLPALVVALKDKNIEIRSYAVNELIEVGPDAKEAVPALIPLLQEKAVRVSAAKALGKIGLDAKDAIPSLAKMLDEDDEVVRTAVLTALRNLGPEAKMPVLIGSLRDKDVDVRHSAAAELAKIGPEAKMAISALAKALDDPNPKVCNEVASALAAMGKDSVPPLMEFLKGKSKNREFAARALGEIGPDAKPAIQVLEKLLGEDEFVLQTAARATLHKLGAVPKPFTDSFGMKFVWIPPGSFTMGSPNEELGRGVNEIQHKVTLSKGFYMGVHLVTQEQWQSVMGNNPSYFKGVKNLPVEQVSWEDCQEFIKLLRKKDPTPYRLPTEAEWEFCCRAGTATPFHFGGTISTDQANYNGEGIYGNGKKGVNRKETMPVGIDSFPPNAWGLHDMHGNVSQWCQDWYGDYPQKDVVDPKGPEKGERRVLRGGSWDSYPEFCRSAYRIRNEPGDRYFRYGVRVCFFVE